MTFNFKFFKRFDFLEDEDLVFYKESFVEQIWNRIEELIEYVDIVVIDSLTALQTRFDDAKDLEENVKVGSLPQAIKRMINKFYELSETSGLTLIVVNSYYTDINIMTYGSPRKILRGGGALRLAKSLSLELRRSLSNDNKVTEKINGEDVLTEIHTKYIAEKNKLGMPKKEAITFLSVDDRKPGTFNYSKDVLNYASKYGLIEKGNAGWYKMLDSQGNEISKIRGFENMAKSIEINPKLYINLKLGIYSKLFKPYEFYYQFDLLKHMLIGEFEAIQKVLKQKLEFEINMPADIKQQATEIIEAEHGLLELKITDFLDSGQMAEAEYELGKFYGKEELVKLGSVIK